jgi:uncharacterized protein YndB with AHSA1/START domain
MDVASHLGAVARVVEDRIVEAKPARVVIASRAYATTLDDLWDALTNKERIPRWFLPIEGDLRLGGKYQLKGNAGGMVRACSPPKSFSLTWEFDGQVTWVNIALAPTKAGETRLTLEHIAHISDHWKQYGPGAVGIGWELGLFGLWRYIGGAMKETFDEAAFGASPEGKAYIRGSGEGWIAADLKSGENKADATRRGQTTIAFYLGEPPPGAAHPGTTS